MNPSPMMKQYLDAKSSCPDAILLFRMGDFYELFFDDAKLASQILNLTLTSRDKGENPIPMAGFPYHQLEGYLAKLIRAGHRVAVCEQVENPKEAKTIVRREVTRIVTPGTLTDDALLDPLENNYLACVVLDDDQESKTSQCGISWLEMSTGRFFAAVISTRRLTDELARIDPVESLWPEDKLSPLALSGALASRKMTVTKRPAWMFGLAGAHAALLKQLGTKTLDGFGFDEETDGLAIRAAGAIVQYLDETQKVGLPHLDRLSKYSAGQSLEIDEATRRSLELTRTMRDGKREGTLLSVIDRTVTAMGSRLLSEWVASPLTDITAIEQRQEAVKEIVTNQRLLEELREKLKDVYDMERLLARVTTNRSSPRDLQYVARTLSNLPAVKARLADRKSKLLTDLEASIDLCPGLRAHLERALREDCPLAHRDGGIIQCGYNDELDRLHELASGGKQWIANYQAAEIERTSISSLKVGFNKVFGYYIEITNTHSEKIPANYIRKQTVKNAERYITPELKEYEEQVLTADERSKSLEYEIFCQLRLEVAAASRQLRTTAAALAQLDALSSLADLARTRNYVCPKMVNEEVLNIQAGRHPVVDALGTAGTFVPNDIRCGADDGCILLITGPNMAGKSTYIRQVALITLLAQIGSFVPASSATIGIVDRIFARVGASDELARGQSTFMVEMVETARILNTATSRSLVILDEIGRGTSTYDGVSLAWAVTEYLHEKIGCRTLFATHYHELTDLARELPGLRNWNVAVREWQEQVIFLHQIIPGAADKSYGIHVARLAGIPKEVNERAKDILAQLENQHLDGNNQPKLSARGKKKRSGDMQLLLFEPFDHPVIDKLRKLDPTQLTPLEALQLLTEFQKEITG